MKFLLILSLPVIVAAFLIERFLSARTLTTRGETKVGLNAQDVVEKLLSVGEGIEAEVVLKRKVIQSPVREGQIVLNRAAAENDSAEDVGRAVWLVGLAQIGATSPQLLKWWKSSRTFGTIGLPLVWLILVFVIFGTKMSVGVAFSWAVVVLAVSCGFCLMQLPMNLQAVKYGSALLEKARLLHRVDDEEAVLKCASAHAYREAWPSCLRVFRKKKKSES